MKRVRGLSLYLVALLAVSTFSSFFIRNDSYAEGPALIISEIKVRNDTAGFDEYIEIFNPGTEDVSLADYSVSYINTPTPTDDQTFATFPIGDGLLEPNHSVVLAKNELDPNIPNAHKAPFSSLSDSGGMIRILNIDEEVIDSFAWTSTSSLAIEPIQYLCTASNAICNANKLQSFERGRDEDNNYILVSPSWVFADPDPESSIMLPAPVLDTEPEEVATENTTEPSPSEVTEETTETQTESQNLQAIQITELLPNPAAPASDSTDEFIELHNPNDQEVNLSGYKLQSGSAFTYSHVFSSLILGPHEYKAFYVKETGNILSNASGQARLLDPNGTAIYQTNIYDTANDGDAWVQVNGAWQWTTTPTPNAANILTVPPLKLGSVKAASTKKAKAAAKKKTAAAKTKKPAAAAAERNIYEDPEETVANLHPNLLAAVGLLTLVYATYEYRHDVSNKMQQLKRNREIRSSSR